MRNLRKIIDTTRLTKTSKTTVSEYLTRFRKSGITYQESLALSDQQLLALFEEKKEAESDAYKTLVALFPGYEVRMNKKGMTRQLLWKEYRRLHPDGYLYSQFCHHFQTWRESLDVTMHQHHEPGDKAFLDYTGTTMTYWDRDAGEQKNAEVFVAILGASELTYVEASESQEKEQFIRSTERAIIYFGGVPRSLVPDNLKSAVTKANKYEPELNPLFDDFAEYYRTVILPARAYHPKDKALVENAVKLTYQRFVLSRCFGDRHLYFFPIVVYRLLTKKTAVSYWNLDQQVDQSRCRWGHNRDDFVNWACAKSADRDAK